jgi:hypothetical protein
LLFAVDPEGSTDPGRAFQGYYGNKDATRKKIARDVLAKGDYFFRTGDVIRCKYDGLRRFTFFEDRIGDTFRWKGENVSTMVYIRAFQSNVIGSWCHHRFISRYRRCECLRNSSSKPRRSSGLRCPHFPEFHTSRLWSVGTTFNYHAATLRSPTIPSSYRCDEIDGEYETSKTSDA